MLPLRSWPCVVIVTCLALAPRVAAAEWRIGAWGGLTLTRTDAERLSADEKAQAGGVVGGAVAVTAGSLLTVAVEPSVSMLRATFLKTVTDTLTYFDLPIVAQYRITAIGGHAISAQGGVVASRLIKATEAVGSEPAFDIFD